jgi:hypothetical protein
LWCGGGFVAWRNQYAEGSDAIWHRRSDRVSEAWNSCGSASARCRAKLSGPYSLRLRLGISGSPASAEHPQRVHYVLEQREWRGRARLFCLSGRGSLRDS